MKRVLLTGGSGFIGRAAVPALRKKGYEVHVLTREGRPGPSGKDGVYRHRCDLFNGKQQAGVLKDVRPTHLLHFAWTTAHGKFWTSPENMRWVQASLQLIQNFVAVGGRRAVGAGTCAEYDWSEGHCAEDKTAARPGTLYGVCKNSVREIWESYSQQAGFSGAWGRIFHLYGPRETPARLVPSLILSLLDRKPALCTAGHQVRDFLHVDDVASAFAALLDSDVRGSVNIASGRPTTIRRVAELIAEKIGRKDLLRLGALPVPANDCPVLTAETARLEKEVGWQPAYDLGGGLAQTIQWWKQAADREIPALKGTERVR